MTTRPRYVVSIYGPSGAGKSQLAKAVVATLGADRCGRIPGDNFLLPATEPLETYLAKPLQYDWHLIRRAIGQVLGTVSTIPDFDFDAFTRRNDTGGNPYTVRQVMVIDAMYPFPDADLSVLLHAPAEIRRERIIERDRRWGTRVIERWDNLEATRQYVEGLNASCDIVLDGTCSLEENAMVIAHAIAQRYEFDNL